MTRFLTSYLAAAVVFVALDAIWLHTMGTRLYRASIGHLMRPDFDAVAAAAFYVLYLAGLVVLVVLPATGASDALLRGALFGLVAYATYDLTNQATLRDWPWIVTLADLAWGTFITAVASVAAYAALARLAP